MTEDQLKYITPSIKASNLTYAPLITEAMAKYKIEGLEPQAAFIAQLAHESGSFNYTREIASGKAYEGRKDLGNNQPGDGVKFKGRGLIQVTGKINYLAVSKYLFGDNRLLATPELLEQPKWAVESACWFWNSRSLSNVMILGKDRIFKGKKYSPFEWVTLRINGGQNGIEERKRFYERALHILK